ncbi:MAG: RDD family protein [Campylobacterota bacterium]|nr:RDD family protein [Campylobacterota bacterium]
MENKQTIINSENLELASMKSRVKAFIIDDLSITVLVMFILWDKIAATNGDLMSTMIVMNEAFFQVVIIKFLYQSFFIWYYGATIGKLVAKIQVIDYDTYGKVSFVNSLIRSMGRVVSEAVFYIGFLIAYYTDSKQTLHDKFGKTLVVNA